MFFSASCALMLSLLSLASSGKAFTNPIRNPGGADPQVTYSDGWYYFIATEWDDLKLARARSIQDLKTAEAQTIYTDSNPSRCCNVWAPELHYLNGRWYIYYTAGEKGNNNLGGQRSHVLIGM
jgi:GH43 family beta-xylosidase